MATFNASELTSIIVVNADFTKITWSGQTWTLRVPFTGISAQDISAAERLAKAANSKFPGAQALDGVWHHKSFDTKTGQFVMELVDLAEHKARHSGGFAEYLNWVAEAIKSGKIKDLPDEQATAVLKTLKTRALRKRVGGRVAEEGFEIISKRLAKKGYKITIKKGGEVVVQLAGKKVGRGIVGWVVKKVGSKGIPVVFAVLASGTAYAKTGDTGIAIQAGARDLVAADLAEAGFQVTVIQGGRVIANEFIDPVGHAKKKFSQLPPEMRAERDRIIRDVQRRSQDVESFSEIAKEYRKDKSFFEVIGEGWRAFWDLLEDE